MKKVVFDLLNSSKGSIAIEYSLIASLIAVVLVGAFVGTGNSLGDLYEETFQTIINAIGR